jgi:DNA-binding NarL/FixJ family response regulator/exonuclease VII small subunit
MAQEKKQNDFNIFIANSIYPEAEALFAIHLTSPDGIKDNCIVVLDTNSLLVPYTIGKKSLDEIRHVYAKLAEEKRLMIPGQVAREFANNRANKLVQIFQQLSRKINSVSQLHRGKYPLLESLQQYQEAIELEEQIDALLKKYRGTVREVLNHIRSWTWNDPVSLLYAEIFKQGVVFDPSFDESEVETELARRQLHHIPPGYKDSGKDDKGIGDLLVWFTILEAGETHKRSVIFVSGEEKPDWWYKSEGQALYPRYELVDEFRRYSDGHSFHIVAFADLLDLYGVSESVVEEIRAREEQERVKLDYGLNATEVEILELSRQGLSTRDMANILNLVEGTVRNYLSDIYEKLGARNRMEAIQKAHDIGLLTSVEVNVAEISTIQNTMTPYVVANYFDLTERELEVLGLTQKGMQTKEIAETLGLSDGTIRNYLSSIYSKLSVSNKIEAVQKAVELGLLKSE